MFSLQEFLSEYQIAGNVLSIFLEIESDTHKQIMILLNKKFCKCIRKQQAVPLFTTQKSIKKTGEEKFAAVRIARSKCFDKFNVSSMLVKY